MKKKVLIVASTILIIVVVAIILFMIVNNKATEDINQILEDETKQTELLTLLIEDSITNLDLGKYGDYQLSIEPDSIVNILTGQIMLDSSFTNEFEVSSNNPQEFYHIKYTYNQEERKLSVDITGTFIDTSTTRQIYKLDYASGKIKFERVETIILDNV